MHESEGQAFNDLLKATAAYYDRKLSADTLTIYWRGLADLPLGAVRQALNAHVQDPKAGQFMPKIADIRRAIESTREDGHPGPDEAWSIALPARHEAASVVWTDQIAAAFFAAALPLLEEGDKIAARKAFIERYEHELVGARRAGVAARWHATLGHDPAQREQAVDAALRAGRLTDDAAGRLLPAPAATVSDEAIRALESGLKNTATSDEKARANIARMRAILGRAA